MCGAVVAEGIFLMPALNEDPSPANDPPPLDYATPDIADDESTAPEFSSQWFAYIAVGITIVAMIVGIVLMVVVAIHFFR